MAKKVPKRRPITVNGVEVPPKRLGIDDAKELLGWRDAKEGEHGYPYVGPSGKGKFVLDNNKKNRPLRFHVVERYKDQMLRGEWAGQWNSPSETHNGETAVVDSEGTIVSFAHRGVALILAELERQRLHASVDGPDSPAAKKLREYGCNGPITIDALLVEGVDPKSADTADIGETRTLGDILYRRGEFSGMGFDDSLEKRLSNELAVALRLVWLRLQGLQVSRGPKGHNPELLIFLERHTLLKDALLYIDKINGGSGKNGRKITAYVTLGYAAGLMYMAAFSAANRESYEEESLDLSSKPDNWETAERFWALLAENSHSDESADDAAIESLRLALDQNLRSDSKYSRDAKCTLVARSFLSWAGSEDNWSSVDALIANLDADSSNVQRFGGLDVDQETLMDLGVIEDDRPTVRTSSGEWEIGKKAFVVGSAYKPCKGTIQSFTDDGKKARVVREDGKCLDCNVEWLTTEKPSGWDDE